MLSLSGEEDDDPFIGTLDYIFVSGGQDGPECHRLTAKTG